MATYGLTDAGLVLPTGNDLLLQFRQDVESQTGLTFDWSADTVGGVYSASTAALGGTVVAMLQAIWDVFAPGNAVGAALNSIGQIRGVYREAATYSSVTLTLTGTSGTIIPSGSLVQGGGPDNSARWRLSASTVLSGGTGSVVAVAVDPGAIIAGANDITTIVTPVAGWTGVTNPAAANTGQDQETDQAYRLRQLQSLQQSGFGSANALRSQLLALTENEVAFTSSCVILDNPETTTTTIGGLTFYGSSFAPILWPDTLTDSQIELVAKAVYPYTLGIWSMGPTVTDSTGVATVVTGGDGFPHPVRWYWAVPVAIPVALVLTLKAGYTLADVQTGVQAAVVALFAELAVGETVYTLSVQLVAKAVNPTAILGIAVTLDGVAADYAPAITEIVQIDGTVSVSV